VATASQGYEEAPGLACRLVWLQADGQTTYAVYAWDLPFVLMNFSFNVLDHTLVIHTPFPHPFIALSFFCHQTGMVSQLGLKFFPIVRDW
jgi:hypothetical protein